MLRAPTQGARRDTSRSAFRQAIHDFFESCGRVARNAHIPTREGVVTFFANQVLVNTVAWTAGVMAAALVESFFEVKGFRNLWGLAAFGSRTLVSQADYRMIMTLASYCAGLITLILMRHLVLRWITEFRCLRLEREPADGARRQRPSDAGRRVEDLGLPVDPEWDD